MTLNLSEHLEPSGLERVEVFDDPMGAAFAIGVHAGAWRAIVSKRRDSIYRSGRSPNWLKMKNPSCEAVRRRRRRTGEDDQQ